MPPKEESNSKKSPLEEIEDDFSEVKPVEEKPTGSPSLFGQISEANTNIKQ